jgi:hypothetical protein
MGLVIRILPDRKDKLLARVFEQEEDDDSSAEPHKDSERKRMAKFPGVDKRKRGGKLFLMQGSNLVSVFYPVGDEEHKDPS